MRLAVNSRALAVGAALFVAALLAACGSGGTEDANTTPGGATNPNAYANLAGEVRLDGSSTVFPISEAVAEEFSKVARTRVNVAFSGTGGGFEKFCRGEIQISNASRRIKPESDARIDLRDHRLDVLALDRSLQPGSILTKFRFRRRLVHRRQARRLVATLHAGGRRRT